ncbi:hypothetical protein [Streptomyces violaceusniger]|uniref:hypothetical protein n=1 Tax=Streptomyces violaceusniger TaxID=68280 RepID=UPI003677D926
MFTHRSASSPSSRWCVSGIPRNGPGRFDCSRIPTRIYDAMLLFLVIFAVTQHVLGRGILLAAYLVFRLTSRRLAHSRLTPSAPGHPNPGQQP